jgi:hypothetical protein
MTEASIDELREMRVERYGRGLYWVDSKSRHNKRHLVDLEGFRDEKLNEPVICNCEAFRYHHHRPCHHILRVFLHRIEEEMTPQECEEALQRINEVRNAKKKNRRR